MPKEENIVCEGVVVDLYGGKFKVEVENLSTVIAYLSGKIRRYHIKILIGDKVRLELSPYDFTQGRIVYRFK